LARVGTRSNLRPAPNRLAQKLATISRPWYSKGIGGIDMKTSSVSRAGRVDISVNSVGVPDAKILGVPLVELDAGQFSLPITTYTTSYFLTARLAARQMIPNKSGVIMTVTALPSRTGTLLNGGYGPAQAAKEALTRDLSAELAPRASAWSACDRTACRKQAR
jgi:NAD(P)-dependent dehydrogenase (short-subunit alcohol dehydrogenase family)